MTLPTLTIFDTLTGEKRPLIPVRPGHIGLYVCGVTVYDLIHIGHARVYLTFDIVTRWMRHRGYDVTYVRNYTDVDDKIIRRAAEQGVTPLELADRYIGEMTRDMEALGVPAPDAEPRVTGHIHTIIDLIRTLIDNRHAYEADGDVYFAVESFDGYGKLSNRRLEDMRAGERVEVDPRKRNPFDFALWKAAKPGEPAWESPWGPGRPGWHIECSAMSAHHLGPTFDIHGGGKDLVFPHHENEIAQSECAHHAPYVQTWMHIGLVNIDGEKMSKSLGNFWTVRDVLALYHFEVVRFFMFAAHYRKPVSYSQANLELARGRVEYLYRTRLALTRLWREVERPAASRQTLDAAVGELTRAMDDDFNTPVAMAVLVDAARRANEWLATKKLRSRPDVLVNLSAMEEIFALATKLFGVLGDDPEATLADLRSRLARQHDIDPAWVAERIAARTAARGAKDWTAADAIRDELAARWVELMDGPDGTDWRIVPPPPDLDDSGEDGVTP